MKTPTLKQNDGNVSSHALAAKNIRIELKICFPEQKFSVTSSSFSMGDSVDVSWTDGPTTDEVNKIINKYEYGTFDGMTDCQGTKETFCKGMYGESKYVHAQRQISEFTRAKEIKRLEIFFGMEFNEMDFDNYSRFNREINSISFYKAA